MSQTPSSDWEYDSKRWSEAAFAVVVEACEKHGLLNRKRIHAEAIKKKVGQLLSLRDTKWPLWETVDAVLLWHRKKRWLRAFQMSYKNTHLSLELERAIERVFYKNGRLWEEIKQVIEDYNAHAHSPLPTDKINIALSLFGKRELTLREFTDALGIRIPEGMSDGMQQASSLRQVWRSILDKKFTYEDTSTTPRLFLTKQESALPNQRQEAQEYILQAVRICETHLNINLWGSSWVTLSRNIQGRESDFMTITDFFRFVKKAGH